MAPVVFECGGEQVGEPVGVLRFGRRGGGQGSGCRLGFDFVKDLKAASASAAAELDALEELIDYRNAIGHGDETTIASIEAGGRIRATKASYRSYRRIIDHLAGTMDDVVAHQLSALLGINRPW